MTFTLYDAMTDEVELAPVFDCGSSLYPQADENMMKEVLSRASALEHRIYNIPLSAIVIDGKKIRYFDFISSLQNKDCNEALKRIVPRINMGYIADLVENTPYLTGLQKEFYLLMLTERKARILDHSLSVLKKREQKKSKRP